MPCAYRQLLGFDCPFCGGQRALLLLLQGRVWASVCTFPALIPLLATLLLVRRKRFLKIMLVADLAIVLVAWIVKLCLNA